MGAGIGGLTAAATLRRAGVDVLVLEQADRVREAGAGLALGPNAMIALRSIGLAEAVEALGARLRALEHRRATGQVLARWATGVVADRLGEPLVGVARPDLHRVLAADVDPADLRLGAEVVAVHQDPGGASVTLASGEEVTGAFVVGADGSHSLLRAGFDNTALRYAGYTEWRGVVSYPSVEPGVHVQWYGPGAVFGVVPLRDGRAAWFGRCTAPAGGTDAPGTARRTVLDLYGDWDAPVAGVLDATTDREIARADIFDLPRRPHWGRGRVTLLGDAAHPTTPTLGQGAALAIEDAVVLGRCVAQHGPTASALAEYERRRIDRAAKVVKTSHSQGAPNLWSRPLACRARDLMLRSLPERAALRQFEAVVRFEL